MHHSDAYERAHQRICGLLDEQTAEVEVPTCPGWTVKDVVAHLAGFFTAFRSGDPKEVFGPGWGDREVKARRDRALQECVTEWSELLQHSDDLFESQLAPVAVSDVLAHEQDIRTALNRPGARDDENIIPAVEMGLSFVEQGAQSADLPVLRLITEGVDRKVGQGEPVVTLRTTTFELFRALHGRRTVEQVKAMEWEGDPGPWLPLLSIFPRTEDVVEE